MASKAPAASAWCQVLPARWGGRVRRAADVWWTPSVFLCIPLAVHCASSVWTDCRCGRRGTQ